SASARCRARRIGPGSASCRSASNFGRIGRSVCMTAWSIITREIAGGRKGSIPERRPMTMVPDRAAAAPASGWRTEAGQLMRWATYASVGTALLLIAAKVFAYLVTDSVSLLSTLLDSLLDAAASLLNLVAVRQSLVPADREHRFGHGKAEPLAA